MAIGPLQDPVTWYGINYAGMQVTQWDFQNKGTRTSPARLSFVLEVLLCNLLSSVINSVPCDRTLQRAYLPEQEWPSPVNPSLQVHLCPPTMLVQFAFTSQSWLPLMHSSTSTLQTVKNNFNFYVWYKVDQNVLILKEKYRSLILFQKNMTSTAS